MTEAIVDLLRSRSQVMTPGAISVLLGQGAVGTLGQEPAPEVAAELDELARRGELVSLTGCPVCGLAGDVWTVPENVPARVVPPLGFTEDDAADAMAPLIEDGAIELGERVELVERECCLRSARPWRATPRPA